MTKTSEILSNAQIDNAIANRTLLRVKDDAPRLAGWTIIPFGVKLYGMSMNVKAGFVEADGVTYSGEFSQVPYEWLRFIA